MDRWALRVAAYVGLMTDRYPPFRLDQGGTDPGSVPRRTDRTDPATGPGGACRDRDSASRRAVSPCRPGMT